MNVSIQLESKDEALMYLLGPSYQSILEEFQHYLRSRLKHEDMPEEKYAVIEEIRERLFEITRQHLD